MENQQGIHENMHVGNIPQQLNHGGHEVLEVKDVLSSTIGTLNQYTLLRQFVKDPELLDIMNRQYAFIEQEYNITLQCFTTGQEPSLKTQTYMMNQNNDFIYGLKPSQPQKPIQAANEMNDELVSGCLISSLKTAASMKTVAALESTNPVVRRVIADSIPNCIEMAYEISLYQNKHHFYQVPQFAQQDMQQMLNSFSPTQGSMPNNMNH